MRTKPLPAFDIIDDDSIHVGNKVVKRTFGYSSRSVYILEDIVIKVDDEHPPLQNRNEVDFMLKVVRPYDRRFFAKILAHAKDYSWIIQQRHHFRGGRHSRSTIAKVEALIMRYGLEDIKTDVSSYNKNYGVRKTGQPLIYDYGWHHNGVTAMSAAKEAKAMYE